MFILVFSNSTFAGPKADTVYFQNGDKITCEFKDLRNNLLRVSTSDAGSFNIEWDKIDSLYIKQLLIIVLDDGTKIIGGIIPSDTTGTVLIDVGFNTIPVKQLSIIQMYPYHKKFIKRLSGNFGFGYSSTKANKLKTIDFNSKVKYVSSKSTIEASYIANSTIQEVVDDLASNP